MTRATFPLLGFRVSVLLCLYASLAGADSTIFGRGTLSTYVFSSLNSQYYLQDEDVKIAFQEAEFNASKQLFLSDSIDFMATTNIIPADEHTLGSCCSCDDTRAFPLYVSGLAIIHNVNGQFETDAATSLTLDRQTLVDIYSGLITTWNHPNITRLQNSTTSKMPNQSIKVFYINCGSEDDTFTLGMSSFSSSWGTSCSRNPVFPAGEGVDTEQDMYNRVSTTPNSIGYVEYNGDVPYKQMAYMINKAGAKVGPSPTSFVAAAADFQDEPSLQYSLMDSLTATIVDGQGPGSWPFSTFYYITLRIKNSVDCPKSQEFYGFLQWAVTSSSSRLTATSYGYALPPYVTVQESLKMLKSMTCCTPVAPDVTDLLAEGTSITSDMFVSLAQSYFSSTQQDTVTFKYLPMSSEQAISNLHNVSSVVAYSVLLPNATDTNIFPFRFLGTSLVCVYNMTNMTSVDHLVLNRVTLAKIFAKTITTWNHQEITATNPDITLPNQPIVVLPFSDPDIAKIMVSAFTKFDPGTDYSGLMPDDVTTMMPAIADTIQSIRTTPYSIGCVPFGAVDNDIPLIGLVNKAGSYLYGPNKTSVMQAMEDFGGDNASSHADLYLLDAPGSMSWPLCVYSYFLIKIDSPNCAALTSFSQFLLWSQKSGDLDTSTDVLLPPVSAQTSDKNFLLAAECNGSPIIRETTSVVGTGATFPLLVYQSWTISYQSDHRDQEITYSDTSSLIGRNSTLYGLSDFGATEYPLTKDELSKAESSGGMVNIPMMAGSVALIYHLEELDPSYSLVLSRDVISAIYEGNITMWNDPKIVELNTAVASRLPAQAIRLIHRAEASGTAYVLSKAISLFTANRSPIKPNLSPDWPVVSETAVGSANLALKVLRKTYTLGYVEVAYADLSSISYCTIINKDNVATQPNKTGILAAMTSTSLDKTTTSVEIMDRGGVSYPLSTYSYIVVKKKWTNLPVATSTVAFIYWGLTNNIPQRRMADLGFQPLLADELAQTVEPALQTITYNGKPVISQILDLPCNDKGDRMDACNVCGGDNTTCCEGYAEADIKINCVECPWQNDKNMIPIIYMCDGFVDCDNGMDDTDSSCRYSIINTSIALSVIAGILIIVCVAIGVDIFMNRKEKIFRENNVLFMMIVLGGCVLGYATVFVLSQLTKLNDFVCAVQYWFFSYAFVLTFGAMIAKTYQVYMLHRQNSGDMSLYTNKAILRYVGAALGIVTIILIIWTAYDVPKPKLVHNDPVDRWKEEKVHYICGNNFFTVFASLLAASFASLLAIGVVISFLSRGIDFEGNESRLIRNTIFSAAALAVLVVPLLLAFANQYPFAKVILSNVGIIIIVTLILSIYFAPRLVRFHFGDMKSKKSKYNKRGMRLLGPVDI